MYHKYNYRKRTSNDVPRNTKYYNRMKYSLLKVKEAVFEEYKNQPKPEGLEESSTRRV
jgi:hypothetical protein